MLKILSNSSKKNPQLGNSMGSFGAINNLDVDRADVEFIEHRPSEKRQAPAPEDPDLG
jgi:hypothetical protein